jgi:hypothetical protein
MADAGDDKQLPMLLIAQEVHEYSLLLKNSASAARLSEMKSKILTSVLSQQMPDYYIQLCTTYNWEIDSDTIESIR